MEIKHKIVEGSIEALGNVKTIKEKRHYKNVSIVDEKTNEVINFKEVLVPGTIAGYFKEGLKAQFFIRSVNNQANVIVAIITSDGKKIHDMETLEAEDKIAVQLNTMGFIWWGLAAGVVAIGMYLPLVLIFLFWFVPQAIKCNMQATNGRKMVNVGEIREFLKENDFNIEA